MAVNNTGTKVDISCMNMSDPNSLVPCAANVARGSWIWARPGMTSPAKHAKSIIQQMDAMPDRAAPLCVETSVTKNAAAANKPALPEEDIVLIMSSEKIGLRASLVMALLVR